MGTTAKRNIVDRGGHGAAGAGREDKGIHSVTKAN